jgi:hypothetical protein
MGRFPSSQVAIVIPFYKPVLDTEEMISLAHVRHFLDHYDRFLLAPSSLSTCGYEDFQVKRFADSFFTGIPAYSHLLLSPTFYEAFAGYEYILIYQLDALVFSDQLSSWCTFGFDYIGAPWLKSTHHPEKGFSRCGNGGFSLRRIQSFLRVLNSSRYRTEPAPYWRDVLTMPLPDLHKWRGWQRLQMRLRILHEDHFWADRAHLFDANFKVAPVTVGLQFAFECAPGYCYAQNNHRLPFGCHAWTKWDKTFWQPYLLPT